VDKIVGQKSKYPEKSAQHKEIHKIENQQIIIMAIKKMLKNRDR